MGESWPNEEKVTLLSTMIFKSRDQIISIFSGKIVSLERQILPINSQRSMANQIMLVMLLEVATMGLQQ